MDWVFVTSFFCSFLYALCSQRMKDIYFLIFVGEIVAATVLAGELSLVGALAAGHLARAHQELGRG